MGLLEAYALGVASGFMVGLGLAILLRYSAVERATHVI